MRLIILLFFTSQLFASYEDIVQYTRTALKNRLINLKKLNFTEQPIFMQKNPAVAIDDLVKAIYLNDAPDTLQNLVDFFNQDILPIHNREQLKNFLDSDILTASIWRNHSTHKCIITINTRRLDILHLSIEHEITHVIQHADTEYISEFEFVNNLYKTLQLNSMQAIEEIKAKYENFDNKIKTFDKLENEEKFEIRQILLEYCADIQGCMLLKKHTATIDYLKSKLTMHRPKFYASYILLNEIINS